MGYKKASNLVYALRILDKKVTTMTLQIENIGSSARNTPMVRLEQRRHERQDVSGAFSYRYGPGYGGEGDWQNVSLGGASVRLGRYLRPGRHVLLNSVVRGEVFVDEEVEFKARVVWCRPVDQDQRFEAGLVLFRDDGESARRLASILASGASEPAGRMNSFEFPVYPE